MPHRDLEQAPSPTLPLRHPVAAAAEASQADEVVRVLDRIACIDLVAFFTSDPHSDRWERMPEDLHVRDLEDMEEGDLDGVRILLDFTGRERVRESALRREAADSGLPFFFLPGCEVHLEGDEGLEALASRAGLLPFGPEEGP